MRVDVATSHRDYQEFHAHWNARVAREAAWLQEQGIAAVLSNVAYLPLAAASHARLPSVALCSLNWYDIVAPYLGEAAGMSAILAQIKMAYQDAGAFLRVTPALPMGWLRRAEAAPPLATTGRNCRDVLQQRLRLAAGEKSILIGFGGIEHPPAGVLPRLKGIRWLVPETWAVRTRPDQVSLGRIGLDFPDLLASVDALVTKVGYGTFVEAAALGVPVLYVNRADWPETPWLTSWLRRHARAEAITEQDLFSNDMGALLERLWQSSAPPPPEISAGEHLAQRINELIGG